MLEPCLATEVPSVENGGISEDGLVYTFHLREGVKFQPPVDREVTAADFKYSFERMMSEPRAPATSFYMGVVGAEEFMDGKADEISGFKAVDDYTVEITLASPDLSFLNALTMEFCDVVPQEWVEQWGKEIRRHPLGTGRFMFESWEPGQEIVLKKNPNYWEEGKPYLDEIRYALLYNPSTALLKLQQGEIDALGDGVPPADIARLQTDPEWMDYVYTQPLIAIMYLFLNDGMPPYDDPKVREAIAWAVDRDNLVKLQGGQARPSTSSIRPACRATSRARSTTATTPRRPRRCWPRRASPTGSRPCSTPTTSTRTPSSCSRYRPTSRRSASTPASRR